MSQSYKSHRTAGSLSLRSPNLGSPSMSRSSSARSQSSEAFDMETEKLGLFGSVTSSPMLSPSLGWSSAGARKATSRRKIAYSVVAIATALFLFGMPNSAPSAAIKHSAANVAAWRGHSLSGINAEYAASQAHIELTESMPQTEIVAHKPGFTVSAKWHV